MRKCNVLRLNVFSNLACFVYSIDTKGYLLENSTKYAIKYSGSTDQQWTTAMKCMLTDLKWGLAFVSTHFKD